MSVTYKFGPERRRVYRLDEMPLVHDHAGDIEIDMCGHRLPDIAWNGLDSAICVWVKHAAIDDVRVFRDCPYLTYLKFEDCTFTERALDGSDQGFSELMSLFIRRSRLPRVRCLPCNLRTLYVVHGGLPDFSGITWPARLSSFEFQFNSITDIGSLVLPTSAHNVNLSDNKITKYDSATHAALGHPCYVTLRGNPVVDFHLGYGDTCCGHVLAIGLDEQHLNSTSKKTAWLFQPGIVLARSCYILWARDVAVLLLRLGSLPVELFRVLMTRYIV